MQIEIDPINKNDTEMKLKMVKKECLSMTGHKFNIHNVLSSLCRVQIGIECGVNEYDISKDLLFLKRMGINIIIKKDGNNGD